MTPAQPMPPCNATWPLTRRPARLRGAAPMLLGLLVIAGCEKPVDTTQVAARVNDADVTVHQVNFALQQERGLRSEPAEAAGRRVLESLIDQELAVQKSIELKLDRDPQTVQALEAARREVLARAYRSRVGQGSPRPTPEEVRAFFEATPALFGERRVYSLQELSIDVPAARLASVKQRLAEAKSVDDFAEALKAEGLRFSASQVVKPAEQLPMGLVEPFSKMKEGEAAVVADGPPMRVVFVAGVRTEPVSFERAAPAVEQHLLARAQRRAIDDNLKALRTASQIRYQGKFAGGASAEATAGAAPLPPAAASMPGLSPVPVQLPLPEASAEPIKLDMPDAAPAPQAAGSAIDPNLAKKGMGLK